MKAKILAKAPKKVKKAFMNDPSAIVQTERDFKDALLMVSVFANLFILCLWVALQSTAQYDNALVSFFLNR